ncbi:hypothetical protein Tco_0216355 [Tanacetum coccineum]
MHPVHCYPVLYSVDPEHSEPQPCRLEVYVFYDLEVGEGSGQPTDPQRTSTSAQLSNEEPITILSSSQLKKTHKPRKAKRTTKISQSSGPIHLVTDETVYKEWEDRMERAATTASSLEAEQDSEAQTRFEAASKQSNDPPLSRVNTLGSGEDNMKPKGIDGTSSLPLSTFYSWVTAIVNTLDNGEQEITATVDGHVKIVTIVSVRKYLQLADAGGLSSLPNTEIFDQLSLMGNMRRVTKGYSGEETPYFPLCLLLSNLDRKLRFFSPTFLLRPQLQMRLHSQKVEGLEYDLKKTKKLYATAFKKLINRNLETQEGFGDGQEVSTAAQEVSTAAQEVSTATQEVSTASPQRNADTTTDYLTLAKTLIEIRKSAAKDKGKAKMDETESPRKMKQRERAQISRDEEGFTDAEWDDVLARVAADKDFVQQLQAGEKCSEEDLPMKLVELVNQRKKFFAQQRAEAKRNKPMTPAQQKDYMSNYIKNQEGGYSIKQLKSLSFEQVKDIFETTMRRVQSFVPMGSELEVQRLKRAGQEVLEKPVKRQKIGEASGSGEEQSAEKEKELSEEELQKLLVIVPVEELVIQPLQVRYPIIDWEVYSEDTRRYWRIIRVGNHTEAYQIFADMLKKFDRDDLVKLWDLVKERFSTTEPTDDKEKELWVELKRLFEPDNDDILWKLQRYMHDPLVWRLYDTCGVHHVSSVRGHDIFMLVEKEYPLTRGTLGLMMVARLLVEADSEMSRELLRKIFYQANRPRQGGLLGIKASQVSTAG